MKVARLICCVLILVWGVVGTAFADVSGSSQNISMDVEEQCDIPLAPALKSANLASAEACQKLCIEEQKCESFVYISGWGKCFLKAKHGRKVKLRAFAAMRGETPVADHDHTGKDLRRVTKIKTAEDCQLECQKEPSCKGISYFQGYGDCWLKAKPGRLIAKVFSCGIKTSK